MIIANCISAAICVSLAVFNYLNGFNVAAAICAVCVWVNILVIALWC